MFKNFFNNKKIETKNQTKTFYQAIGEPVWTSRNYTQFSKEAYTKNVIANRCINMISMGASSVNLVLKNKNNNEVLGDHPIIDLLKKPNPMLTKSSFFETIYSHRLISGNAYVQAILVKMNIIKIHLNYIY